MTSHPTHTMQPPNTLDTNLPPIPSRAHKPPLLTNEQPGNTSTASDISSISNNSSSNSSTGGLFSFFSSFVSSEPPPLPAKQTSTTPASNVSQSVVPPPIPERSISAVKDEVEITTTDHETKEKEKTNTSFFSRFAKTVQSGARMLANSGVLQSSFELATTTG